MQNSKVKTQNYNPSEIEQKWQKLWEREKIYSPNLQTAKKPFYNLMMFPYPSAEGMHVGNMYAFTGADVYGRFQRMQGKDVFEPIGLDGFGIHSENYAIKVGNHPAKQAEISEKNFYRQLKSIGNGFDWTRTVETYKPEYYKWTQWLFIQLFKAGLAYRKKAPVNFCPSCKTVLADEQVLDGKCERCNSVVEKRDLEQWFFAITKYANRLLANIPKLDWSEKVKIVQRQWIGKSEGALIKFDLVGILGQADGKHSVEVFTTRPDTLYGATFLAVSPELGDKWISLGWQASQKVKEYVKKALKKRGTKNLKADEEKTGVFGDIYGINPLNREKLPVWITDYVLAEYGTGALFGDAHDKRDVEFAKKYKIPLKATVITGDKDKDRRIKNLEECFTGYGVMIESGPFSGLTSKEAIKKVSDYLLKNGVGGPQTTYHLRDWLISRQRYWGPPIPMIFCRVCAAKGITSIKSITSTTGSSPRDTRDTRGARDTSDMAGWFPVPENQLPVKLPFIEDYKPLGTGQAPLASHPEFYKTKCPNCHGDARRETDVSDTFLDSSWYFLRYIATEFDNVPFPLSGQRLSKWLPVDMYIGGAEHSVLHLLYSRFITMALKDLGFINFEEPFAKFRAHGLIVKDGAKMSKSKGNVVIPDEYIKKFGADTLRAYLMFAGPYSQGGDFRDSGIEGMFRFLNRVWRLLSEATQKNADQHSSAEPTQNIPHGSAQFMHKTIKKVTEDIESLNYNTAIAALMEYYNFLSDQKSVSQEEMEAFCKLLAPFAPHVSEELWHNVILSANEGSRDSSPSAQNDISYVSIHKSSWPTYDPKFLVKDEFVIVVQVNGKLRGNIIVNSEKLKVKSYIEELARNDAKVAKYLEGKKVQKVIHVEGKVVNFVV